MPKPTTIHFEISERKVLLRIFDVLFVLSSLYLVSELFDLEYFNVFSSKRILFLLYKLKDLKEQGINVKIVWHFSIEDDDMKEVGEDFACMVNLPFEFISKQVESPFS